MSTTARWPSTDITKGILFRIQFDEFFIRRTPRSVKQQCAYNFEEEVETVRVQLINLWCDQWESPLYTKCLT